MLSYKYQFWDGAVIVIGLGSSLILNAIFFARKINDDSALTLPDVYAKRYGKVVEIMVSICTIISFICLLAGNLVGMGTIISYYMKITMQGAVGVRLDHVFIAIISCSMLILFMHLIAFRGFNLVLHSRRRPLLCRGHWWEFWHIQLSLEII